MRSRKGEAGVPSWWFQATENPGECSATTSSLCSDFRASSCLITVLAEPGAGQHCSCSSRQTTRQGQFCSTKALETSTCSRTQNPLPPGCPPRCLPCLSPVFSLYCKTASLEHEMQTSSGPTPWLLTQHFSSPCPPHCHTVTNPKLQDSGGGGFHTCAAPPGSCSVCVLSG